MCDSENELSNNIFSYPNVNTTISAKGPKTNISNLSIRQKLPSTMHNMPRQRHPKSVCDQGSMYYRQQTSPMSNRNAYRRQTSPMSTRSVCDLPSFNFPPYYSGMSSGQSLYHGRSRSPLSIRSIDSTVSAKDIAIAFKTTKFNSHDIQILKHAYRNLMKCHTRKRFERKRNLKRFLKGNRNSGDDSGEQGSDSSISDDGRSAITTTSKVSHNMTNRQFDISNLRTINERIIKDCTEDLRQNTFKNNFSLGSASMSNSVRSNNSAPKGNNSQKDRFKSSFLLPLQRFNQYQRPNHNGDTDSEHEEIFSETVQENTVFRTESQSKRCLGVDELNLPNSKRKKIISPIKNTIQKILPVASNKKNKIQNAFEFVKPSVPAKKVKPKIQEKLVSKQPKEKPIVKPSQPLTVNNEPGSGEPRDTKTSKQPHVPENTNTAQLDQHETMDITDVSMRPSFIKRKLFTQKLDVIEKSNVSSDGANSPQISMYGGMPKEKNRARKLVTTQSCLNRDIGDDNNLLDLIHKIVPADQMNSTSQSSVNQMRLNAAKPVAYINEDDDDDKWDVTSVVLTCNKGDFSDTYTDEEMFKSDNKTIDANPNGTKELSLVPCRVALVDLNKNKPQMNSGLSDRLKSNDVNTRKLRNCAKSFWDTDPESDVDWQDSFYKSTVKENQQGNKPLQRTKKPAMREAKNTTGVLPSTNTLEVADMTESLYNTAVNTTMNTTVDSVQKPKVGNISFRSHRFPIKKKCAIETCVNDTKSTAERRNKQLIDISNLVANAQNQNSVPKSDSKKNTSKDNIKTKSTEENALTKDRSASNTGKKTSNKTKPKTEDSKKITSDESNPKSNGRCKVEKRVKPVQNKSRNCKATKTTEQTLNNNDVKNKKTNSSKPPNTSSVLDSTIDTAQNTSTVSQRPVRSCRATSQNRSIDVSKSLQLSSDTSFNKSLRSRTIVINLSSSIDNNITFHIKPKNKVVNKTVAPMNARISDVSFSIGSKNTTTPKKLSRSKGKRKT